MNDGGPAFPAPDFIVPKDLAEQHIYRLGQVRGMSLRDYFAAAALQNPAICTGEADHWQIVTWFGQDRTGIYRREIVAKQAMDYANALLAERAKSLTSKE